jgi:hypothetical protein
MLACQYNPEILIEFPRFEKGDGRFYSFAKRIK